MNDDERRTLLRIAREAIEAHLERRDPPTLDDATEIDRSRVGGLFVTLHKAGRLRGCIGTFRVEGSLARTVQALAVDSANDPRFLRMPLTTDDLSDLDIEISLLSPMQRVSDPLAIELGVHGIYVRKEHRAGCFLPQVAATHPAWSKEEFLSICCRDKAGLPADAWRDPATEVFEFTAEVFSEHELPAGRPG